MNKPLSMDRVYDIMGEESRKLARIYDRTFTRNAPAAREKELQRPEPEARRAEEDDCSPAANLKANSHD